MVAELTFDVTIRLASLDTKIMWVPILPGAEDQIDLARRRIVAAHDLRTLGGEPQLAVHEGQAVRSRGAHRDRSAGRAFRPTRSTTVMVLSEPPP